MDISMSCCTILSLLSLVCMVTLATAASAPATVKMSVYYESLCPDSIRFVTQQLYPNWLHFGPEILTVDLNPFGKANFSVSGSGWDFTCQHGPDECRGNKVQACVLDQVPEAKEYVPLIHCIMASASPPDAAAKCLPGLGTRGGAPARGRHQDADSGSSAGLRAVADIQ